MANTFRNTDKVTKETLFILKNELKAARQVYRGYQSEFGKSGNKLGNTINVRKPVRFIGREGAAYQPEAITETTIPVVVNRQSGADFSASSVEMTLDMDYIRERYLKPAAISIANKIDREVLSFMYLNTYNAVGTPGTTPTTLLPYFSAYKRLLNLGMPMDHDTNVILNPDAHITLANALTNVFNPSGAISDQFRTGMIGNNGPVAGIKNWFVDQNVVLHTVGALGGTPLVNGADQTGSSLITDGWTASAATRLATGDVFTIEGVYAVNPQSRQSTGELAQFVCTAPGVSDGSGNMTISISPAIVPSGQYQNVTGSPANNAPITVLGAASVNTAQNMAFHKMAFTLVSVPLEVPTGATVEAHQETDPETGITLRYIQDYNSVTDQWVNRFDVLWGVSAIYPELAVRVCGA